MSNPEEVYVFFGDMCYIASKICSRYEDCNECPLAIEDDDCMFEKIKNYLVE